MNIYAYTYMHIKSVKILMKPEVLTVKGGALERVWGEGKEEEKLCDFIMITKINYFYCVSRHGLSM